MPPVAGANPVINSSCCGPRRDKAAKVATARTLWVPAANNHRGFWWAALVEVTDVYDGIEPICQGIEEAAEAAVIPQNRTVWPDSCTDNMFAVSSLHREWSLESID